MALVAIQPGSAGGNMWGGSGLLQLPMSAWRSMARATRMLRRGGLLVETHRRSPFSQMKTALIYPGRQEKTTEDALARAYEGSTILSCTTSSGYQIGLLFGAGQPVAVKPSPPASGTWYLVYFYGNGMCLETCSYEFAQFRQLGYTVLIPEYPGYGMSSGWASESGCYEAASAAYHYLTETLHAHPTQIVVAGWRLQCRCGHRPRRPQTGGRFDRARCVHEHP